jgi:hypothetical protein
MTDAVHLTPKFGRRVRHADGTLFDEAGEAVTLDSFYRRLIADGDLVADASVDQSADAGAPAKPTITASRPKKEQRS